MRVIYLGTPEFAIKPLESIIESNHKVAAIITQPDRANRRGNKVKPCPVKEYAKKNGLCVLQYERIRNKEAIEELKALKADIMVTCAYGQILSQEILDMTKHGVINIHASLLPKYRGSSPVQWALINGEKTVGITIMQTALEVDSGDIILQKELELNGDENAEDVLNKLSPIGAQLIVKALDLIEEGKAKYIKQDETEVSHYPMLKKEDGRLDFSLNSESLVNFIRGMNPWPGAFTYTQNGLLKVKKAIAINENGFDDAKPGEVVESHPKVGLIIKCGKGCLSLEKVQGENSKEMSIADYLRGKRVEKGSIL